MMGKIMKRNDFGKIVNYTMKGNNKSKLLATEGVRSDSKQHIAESFSCQAGLNTRIRTPVYHISLSFSKQDSGKLTDDLMGKDCRRIYGKDEYQKHTIYCCKALRQRTSPYTSCDKPCGQ